MQSTSLPHIVTVNDLFCNFDINKLKGKGNIKRTYKCADKKSLMKKIFLTYLAKMFDKFLEGGQVFQFPGHNRCTLQFRRMKDSTLKKQRASGYLNDLDLLMSRFSHYEPVVQYRVGGLLFIKPVKLSKNYKQQIIDKVNTGYKYC